jgi:hypothetical protein
LDAKQAQRSEIILRELVIPCGEWLRTVFVNLNHLRSGSRGIGRPLSVVITVGFVAAGLLLAWSGYIHFNLWRSDGYRHIASIGPLFFVQSITAVLLGVLVMTVRQVWTAAVGAGFALSTMLGFLISVEHGLFGFKDSWEAPFARQAFAIDVATIAMLTIVGLICLAFSVPSSVARMTPVVESSKSG